MLPRPADIELVNAGVAEQGRDGGRQHVDHSVSHHHHLRFHFLTIILFAHVFCSLEDSVIAGYMISTSLLPFPSREIHPLISAAKPPFRRQALAIITEDPHGVFQAKRDQQGVAVKDPPDQQSLQMIAPH